MEGGQRRHQETGEIYHVMIGLFHGIYKMKRTKETTSERRKDTILNMKKTESRTRNPIKKQTEG
jgi:hypothetical protein